LVINLLQDGYHPPWPRGNRGQWIFFDGDALRLPTFDADGAALCRGLTMIVHRGVIEHVLHPVWLPGQHVREVLDWPRAGPAALR
jgi:hypothetical protein